MRPRGRLLPAIDPRALPSSAKEAVVRKLIGLLGQSQSGSSVIRALSQLRTPDAVAALDAYLRRHTSRDISFGFGEKAALIEYLGVEKGDPAQQLDKARQLMLASEADAENIEKTRGGISVAGSVALVDTAYLDLVAAYHDAAGDRDQEIVARIVGRCMTGSGSMIGADRPRALGRALRVLPESWTLRQLKFPSPPVVDPPWDPIWEQRKFILGSLTSVPGSQLPRIARAVLGSLPVDDSLADELAERAAHLSLELGRSYYRKRLDKGGSDALVALGRLGDKEEIRSFIDRAARGATDSSELPEVVADALLALDGRDRVELLVLVLKVWPGPLLQALPVAIKDRIDHPRLRAEAESILTRSVTASHLASAVRYLAALDPSLPWMFSSRPPVLGRLVRFLADSEAFDWVTVAQSFPTDEAGVKVPLEAQSITTARRIGVVIKQDGALEGVADHGVLVLSNGEIFISHLIAVAASKGDPAGALTSIDSLAHATSTINILPARTDASTLFEAYLSWLAASPASTLKPDCRRTSLLGPDRLLDSNPLVTRASAALSLAAPQAALSEVECNRGG